MRPLLQLWNVGNVEAHVRNAMRRGLTARGAYLSPAQEARLFQYLVLKCWSMSGLIADGKTFRHVWEIRGFVAPLGQGDSYIQLKLRPEPSPQAAQRRLDEVRDWYQLRGRTLTFVSIVQRRPRGVYDPAKGPSFSTWSFRLLANHRIDDWYREDPEFGDTRYEKPQELSLEALAQRVDRDGEETPGEIPVPRSRLEIVDRLNGHHYRDHHERADASETFGEEVLAHEALGF